MPAPPLECKGFRNSRSMKKCSRKSPSRCTCDNTRPSKSTTKMKTSSLVPLNMIESEYIRNLQLQIYYLEMESKHLWKRTQEQGGLKKTGDHSYGQDTPTGSYSQYGLDEVSKYDKTSSFAKPRSYSCPDAYGRPGGYKHSVYQSGAYNGAGKFDSSFGGSSDYTMRGSAMNNDLGRLAHNFQTQEAAIKQLNAEKTKANELLEQEKELREKDMRKAKEDISALEEELSTERQNKVQCEMDLHRLLADLKQTDHSLKQIQSDQAKVQSQINERDQQLRAVKHDLDETRSGLHKRDEYIKDLQEKYDKSHEFFNRVAAELKDENKSLKENLAKADMKLQELESNRDSLVETTNRLIKENGSLDTALSGLHDQLEQNHRILGDREAQLQASKREIADLDNKLRKTTDELRTKETHKEQAEKRLHVQTNRVNELENLCELRDADIRELQQERSALENRADLLESELVNQRSEVEELNSKTYDLNSKLREVEKMKNLQISMQTEKWEEFGKLANSMQKLSRCMSSNNNGIGTKFIIETE